VRRHHSGRDNCSRPAISTISLDYDLSSEAAERFEALGRGIRCFGLGGSRIWRIPLERQEADWKRMPESRRRWTKAISLGRANPSLVKSNVEFLQVPLGKETLYFHPRRHPVIAGAVVAAFRYNDVEIVSSRVASLRDSAAPSDSRVVGRTWRFLNRNGGPDRRLTTTARLPFASMAKSTSSPQAA